MSSLIRQRTSADCGLVALAMYLDLGYAEVRRAALTLWPESKLTSGGMHGKDLVKMGKVLGVPLVRVSRNPTYLHGASGVLAVLGKDLAPGGHWVTYLDGVVLDGHDGGRVWTSGVDYLVYYRARPAMLVTRA